MTTTFSTPTGLLTPELRHSIFYMYPTNTVSQIFSLSICTLMYVYRIIAPEYTSKPPPPFRASLHIKGCQFRYGGQQNTLTTSSIPTKTFNMSCKPTNTATRTFNTFLGSPVRHLELQYVPSTTYTVTQLNNMPTTASIATHTFSSSIGPPTPPLRLSVRSWDHQH